jgi:hypothetical protein
MNSKYFGLKGWQVLIEVMISKQILLDWLYLHKMITDGKRRKDKKNSTPFHFALPPKIFGGGTPLKTDFFFTSLKSHKSITDGKPLSWRFRNLFCIPG